MYKRLAFVALTFIYIAQPSIINAQSSADWYMAGANPQRTSWVSEEVNPNSFSSYGILWYRPIEGYINQATQIVTGRNKIYVSTATGLYALNFQTGDEVWRLDTALPITHSPTLVNDVLYVAGMDHILYALNADSGAILWTFQADAGFSVNPLVVNGTVYAGSRDGYMHAINASTGVQAWQYPAANEAPLGPIMQSAAYANNKIYFASNDMYAYALDANNGSLTWRSTQLPGDGFQSFWPVVYEDKVIFTTMDPYSLESQHNPGVRSNSRVSSNTYYAADFVNGIQPMDIFKGALPDPATNPSWQILGPSFSAGSGSDTTGISWQWPSGSEVIDGSRIHDYLENDNTFNPNSNSHKPWRRNVIVLEQSNGTEYTMDTDTDGLPEYAPFSAEGTKSGSQYPPILLPNAGGTPGKVVAKYNIYQAGQWIPRKQIMGWHLGSNQYLQNIGTNFAIDEPTALSAAGDIIYTNLCCDREAHWLSLNGGGGEFWGYSRTLESLAENPNPQYWHKSLAATYDDMWTGNSSWDAMPRRDGGYSTVNGVYHSHGLQNPLIPYQDMLFTHRANAIIALGPNPPQTTNNSDPTQAPYELYEQELISLKKKPLLSASSIATQSIVSKNHVGTLLESEVQKIVDTGFLRPGYYPTGQTSHAQLSEYFENPGETLYTLSIAYPYLSATLQSEVQSYLDDYFQEYFINQQSITTGYAGATIRGQLQPREYAQAAPEIEADMANFTASMWDCCGDPWDYPPQNAYYLLKYAQAFPSKTASAYNTAKARLPLNLPDDTRLSQQRWEFNAYFIGYTGFLELQSLAGMDQTDASLRNQVQSLLNGLTDGSIPFVKDNPWYYLEEQGQPTNKRDVSIARNFLYITPELADFYRTTHPESLAALAEYETTAPMWHMARFDSATSEGVMQNLLSIPAIFQAKVFLANASFEELNPYLDVPAFEVGDLYYIQNLVASYEAPSDGSGPSPTPAILSGDADGDDDVDFLDYLAVIANFLGVGGSADFNFDNIVNIFDFNILVKNFGFDN